MLERDVQRFNERKELERQVGFSLSVLFLGHLQWSLQIALLELILPFMEYMEAKRSYTEAKAKQRALHKRVQTLQEKNQPMHDFKKHLETRLRRINEQRDGKKDAAKKKFKSMKAKWDENEKLVTCIVCPFRIFINRLHYSGRASRGDFKRSLEPQEGRKNPCEEDPRNRTAYSKSASRPRKAHPSRRYVRDRRGDCMFSLFKTAPL